MPFDFLKFDVSAAEEVCAEEVEVDEVELDEHVFCFLSVDRLHLFAVEDEAAKEEEDDEEEELPLPVTPPFAPVAAILAWASASVVHVTEVPALFTKGKDLQTVPAPHGVMTNAPLTHWAKASPTQATSFPVQEEFLVSDANFAFSA